MSNNGGIGGNGGIALLGAEKLKLMLCEMQHSVQLGEDPPCVTKNFCLFNGFNG
jgi:hypothetical protein